MRIVIACRLVFGAVALLPQQAAAQFAEKKVLTLAIARKIVATAETEAARNHLAGVVAVVDDGGWPILIERMDHAAYTTSVELASGKARTAALFKKPSQALEDAIKHGRVAAVTAQDFVEMGCDSEKTNDGRLIGVLPDSVIVRGPRGAPDESSRRHRNRVVWIEVGAAVDPPGAGQNLREAISRVGVRGAHVARVPLHQHKIGSGLVQAAVERRHLAAVRRRTVIRLSSGARSVRMACRMVFWRSNDTTMLVSAS